MTCRRGRAVVVAVVAAAAATATACGSGPPYPDEEAMCSALQSFVDARAASDSPGERAAFAAIRRTSLRTQNINFALFGQSFTNVADTRTIPNAFDRLVNECLRVGLTIRNVRIPPTVVDE